MATKKEIAETEEGVMALSNERPDWMQNTDRGNEDVGLDDLTIPRIDVIQDLSPQHKKNKPEYIEGAEPGMLFNTVTGTLYPDGIVFVPVYFRKEWVIWKHQSAGGGFNGAYATKVEAEAAFVEQGFEGETTKVNGVDVPMYDIVDTAQHFGMIITDGRIEEVVMSMAKSKMKVSRKLNSMAKLAGGDRFSRGYKVGPVADQNAAGQDYWNISFHQLGFVSEAVYRAGEKMYEAVSSGTVGVNNGATEATTETEVNEADREY